jgi:hypothetical protein
MNKKNLIVRLNRDLVEIQEQKAIYEAENRTHKAEQLSLICEHIEIAIDLLSQSLRDKGLR